MGNFIEFWDSLGYNGYFFIAVVVLFLGHVVYSIYRSVVVLSKPKIVSEFREQGVSVIITSNNRADSLKENLESFLNQDYPNFEVIVVDECSEDDTQDVLAGFQQRYPNLRTTRIFPDTKFHCTKKLAINIGVLAATHDILLFSEINCTPASPNWVRTMQSYFDSNTAVVIGYTNYLVGSAKVCMRRYFRFCRFLKMLLLVKSGTNVLGDGSNMAYRKRYYIEKRGFSRNSQIYMGYDSEMVKELSEKGGVRVVKDQGAYMWINDNRKKTWTEDISYYYANKRDWSLYTCFKADLDTGIKYLFYILSFYLYFSGVFPNYLIMLVVLTFLIDIITVNVYLKHLYQTKLFLTSFIVNIIGFIYRWYYIVYSIFTSKKWR